MREVKIDLSLLDKPSDEALSAAVAAGKAMWLDLMGDEDGEPDVNTLLNAMNASIYVHLRVIQWLIETNVVPPDLIRASYLAMGDAIGRAMAESNSLYDKEPEGNA